MKFEDRHYLNVPYAEREKVKAIKGRYDSQRKLWYVAKGTDPASIAQWDSISSVSGQNVSPVEEFAAFCEKHGLVLDGDPIMDGKDHRVPLKNEKDKNKKSGKYRAYLDGKPNGWVMNFRDGGGKAEKWKASGVHIDTKDYENLQKEWANNKLKRDEKSKVLHKETAIKAYKLWGVSDDVEGDDHPYLKKKGVNSYGLRQTRDGKLLIPARNIDGKLRSLKFIGEGEKRFLKDSEKIGCFYVIQGSNLLGEGPIIIAEGYSTAASIHEATGLSVIVAFDAYNLLPVAEGLRKRYKNSLIVIAADDDHKLEVRKPPLPNAGIVLGTDAAKACGGHVIIVELTEAMKVAGASDFNDVHSIAGLDEVKRQINEGLDRIDGQLATAAKG